MAALIAALFFSCDTPKHIAKMQRKYCPVTSDSITTKIERHDSLIYISTDPISFGLETPCDTLVRIDTVFKKDGIKEEIKGNYKRLVFTCKDDSLKQVISALNKTETKKEIKIVTEKCSLPHVKWYHIWGAWWLLISVIALLIFITWKIAKSYFKIP